jgi:predicted GH43/DUF377 family glycosyl hydrolase
MSIPVLQEKIILSPEDISPLNPDFKVIGTFNPGATRYGDEIILLVRVAEAPPESKSGKIFSPRVAWKNGEIQWLVDQFNNDCVDDSDPRKFQLPDGRLRLRFISHLRLVRLSPDGADVREISILPDLLPQKSWEEFGIEDARITKIGDEYYITYVAVSQLRGVATGLITTNDFIQFNREGIIFPTENKDVVLLPEKWNDFYIAFHRPVSDQWLNAPSVETAMSKDCLFWGRYGYLFGPRAGCWDSLKIGTGPPPLRVPEGWLLLYHGVSPPTKESPAGRYCMGAVLLDANDPLKILARSEEPLLCPDRPYEQKGYVPNVIFPTGAMLSEDNQKILLFNGAADSVTVLFTIEQRSIIENLKYY